MIEADTLITLLILLEKIRNLSVLKKKNKIKISAKHIVFISESAVQDFLRGDTKKLKGPRTESIFLYENEISRFANKIYRPRFKVENYCNKWKDTPIWQEKSHYGGLIYRKLYKDLFESELKGHDPIGYSCVKELFGEIDNDFNFSEFLQISYFEDFCGGYNIIEHYDFKPIFIVALWIENLNETPIKLKNYKGKFYYPNNSFEFRGNSWGFGEKIENELPPVSLKKGESLLIPEMLLFGELKDSGTIEPFLQFHREIGERLTFDIYDDPNKLLIFGPSISIEEINFEKESLNIHSFNSSNVLRLSKDYLAGSCPFLFGFDGKKLRYIKELFVNSPTEEIEASNFKFFIIVELEDEISYFDEIKLATDLDEFIILHEDIKLKKGEHVLIRLPDKKAYKKLILKGSYQPINDLRITNPDMIHTKIKLIENFSLSQKPFNNF